MSKSASFEELVELKQSGRIGWLGFVLGSDQADEYRKWCQEHSLEQTDGNAELFLEMTDDRVYESQLEENDMESLQEMQDE